jgi:membrane protease YdiL (CAAX protease family)
MKKRELDIQILIGFFMAHILLFFTYSDQKVFWYMFTATMLILISYSIIKEHIDDVAPLSIYLTYGLISGLLLFGLFWLGNLIFELLHISVQTDISRLYKLFSPTLFWHYLSLMLIAVPGEEIFWRGFIQKRLLHYFGFKGSVFISSLMYASVNLYTGEWILIFATFIAGLFWGTLYVWKRSIPLVIVSHLVFDLFIFILLPL